MPERWSIWWARVMSSIERPAHETGAFVPAIVDIRPEPRPGLLKKMVRAGKLCMKTGEGFFDYSK